MSDDAKRLDRARLLFRQGRWSMAVDVLRDHLAAEPEDGVALAMLAVASLHMSPADLPAARDAANEAARHSPSEAYVLYVRALVTREIDLRSDERRTTRADRLRRARTLAGEAIAAEPDYLATWQLLAQIAGELSEYEVMLASADRAVRIAPLDADSHALRVHALVRLTRWGQAGTAVIEGLRVAPEHAELLRLLGHLHLVIGRRQAAAIPFADSLRLDPNDRHTQLAYHEATASVFRQRSTQIAAAVAFAYLCVVFGVTWFGTRYPAMTEAALPIIGLSTLAAALVLWHRARRSRGR